MTDDGRLAELAEELQNAAVTMLTTRQALETAFVSSGFSNYGRDYTPAEIAKFNDDADYQRPIDYIDQEIERLVESRDAIISALDTAKEAKDTFIELYEAVLDDDTIDEETFKSLFPEATYVYENELRK